MASKMILPHGKSRAGAGRVAALDRFANNAAPSPLSGQDLYAAFVDKRRYINEKYEQRR